MIIVIIGVAGMGKTTVGRALAETLGWGFTMRTTCMRRKIASVCAAGRRLPTACGSRGLNGCAPSSSARPTETNVP